MACKIFRALHTRLFKSPPFQNPRSAPVIIIILAWDATAQGLVNLDPSVLYRQFRFMLSQNLQLRNAVALSASVLNYLVQCLLED